MSLLNFLEFWILAWTSHELWDNDAKRGTLFLTTQAIKHIQSRYVEGKIPPCNRFENDSIFFFNFVFQNKIIMNFLGEDFAHPILVI